MICKVGKCKSVGAGIVLSRTTYNSHYIIIRVNYEIVACEGHTSNCNTVFNGSSGTGNDACRRYKTDHYCEGKYQR